MYNYKEQREAIFTEDGVPHLMIIRDKVHKLLKVSEFCSMTAILHGITGDSWKNMACVDYLIEIKEIKEIEQKNQVTAQHRIFTIHP